MLFWGQKCSKVFIHFKGPLILDDNVKDDYINIRKAEEIKEKFKSDLGETIKGKPEHQKSKKVQ